MSLLTLHLLARSAVLPSRQEHPREAAAIVTSIMRADYQGDRAALQALERELARATHAPERAAAVTYWRGYALWRRAINGFNDSVAPAELEADLRGAIRHFERSLQQDPNHVESAIGRVSCFGYLLFMQRSDAEATAKITAEYKDQGMELLRAAAQNPRLLWVVGPSRWYAAASGPPEERDTKQTVVIAGYERALQLARDEKKAGAKDPLAPTWGEPELLMNLAWSHLNREKPDPALAEKCALEALALVPDWRYVRDILLPQIRKAGNPR